MTEKTVPTKPCLRCGTVFPATLEFFHKSLDTLHSWCKLCRSETKREYWWANRDLMLERQHQRKGKRKAQYQRWYQEHPDYSRQWYAAHREEVLARWKKKYVANRQQLITQASVNNVRRAARKKDLPDTYTTADWEYALQYWHGLCAICEQPPGLFGTALAQDHWIPLTAADCPGTVPWNIVPLCNGKWGCNMRKRSTEPLIFLHRHFGNKRHATQKYAEIAQFLTHMRLRTGD